MTKLFVFDLDGCLLNSEHRLAHLLAGRLAEYDAAYSNDVPILQGVAVYNAVMCLPGAAAVFVTGREERARGYTQKQLDSLIDFDYKLLMRPNGNTSHDLLLKPLLLAEAGILPKSIFLVFEDRASMVLEWRRLGVMCYQTANGNY